MKVENLKVYFPIKSGILKRTRSYVKAVDDVSFYMQKGETVAIVGESGCGKSTLGKAIAQLIPKTSGNICFQNQRLEVKTKESLRAMRRKLQIIFQDPYASMNPKLMIKDILAEGLKAQKLYRNKQALNTRLGELLNQVNLPESALEQYPHEFSGGQRQRVAIARALSVSPDFIICDEPSSALDISVQAQILNLLNQLKKEFGLTYLFITHDLSVVSYIADRVMVMYLGKIVEQGFVQDVLKNAKHPYTQALLASAPEVGKTLQVANMSGELPSPMNPPLGCAYHPRCPLADSSCKKSVPELKGNLWQVACHKVV
ncbi:ABC transporter ATP-binding protein [Francisellaceae bacterium]|nr:ABC transporter ATP-binding protein [Francisellaceae bacterium]